MNAKIAFTIQSAKNRVWDGANAKLQRGFIGDHFSDVVADAFLFFGDFPDTSFREGVVDLNGNINVFEVNEGIPQDARHVGVNLGNDQFCRLGCGFGDANFYTKRAKAVFIRWRHLDKGCIQWQHSVFEEPWRL